MARSLDAYDGIAIAEIIVYTFFLAGGIYLSIKHGFKKSSGWRFLIVLALARLIGSSLLLATINSPNNESLYVGYLTLNGVGFGPLILMLLGLLSRLFDSINRNRNTLVEPLYLRFIKIMMLIAMVLLIYGGTQADYSTVDGKPKIEYVTASKVGAGLMIGVLVLLIVETLLLARNRGYICAGERRILLAVVLSIPFVLVRLVYTCLLILGNKSQDVWLYLGAGVLMEMIVVLICEVVGFTLQKVPPPTTKEPLVEQESGRV